MKVFIHVLTQTLCRFSIILESSLKWRFNVWHHNICHTNPPFPVRQFSRSTLTCETSDVLYVARACGAHRQHRKLTFSFNGEREVFKGASVCFVSLLADSCNMLWCLWLPQSASCLQLKKKVLALKTVVEHNVVHADGRGGTVH